MLRFLKLVRRPVARSRPAMVLASGLVGLAAAACATAVVSPAPTAGLPESTPRPALSSTAGDSLVFDTSIYRELNPAGPKQIDPRLYRQLLPRDAIEPIYIPAITTAEEAALHPADLVIGVSIGEQARAYPIGILSSREMVNDELGGVPILVTW